MKFKRKICSTFFGNLFEHYDTALFGLLSPFLASLLFPKKDPILALILTYAIFPIGMIIRPVGAIFFGYFVSKKGAQFTLFFTLLSMGTLSLFLAVTPLGMVIVTPLIFSIIRIMQNFFTAGEVVGGAVFLMENTPSNRQDLASGFYGSSTLAGILLASLGVTLLSIFGEIEKGWRFLYLLGTITAFFGCLLRSPKTDLIQKKISIINHIIHIKRIIKLKSFMLIILVSGFSYATYTVSLVLMNGFVPLVSKWSKEEMIFLNTLLLILDFLSLPLFGYLSSKISYQKIMLFSSLILSVSILPLCEQIPQSNLVTIISIRTILVLLGVAFSAPFYSWAKDQIPSEHRYTILPLAYALGSQLIGSPTATISLSLFKATKIPSSIGWYLCLIAIATSTFLFFQRKKETASST